MIPLHSSCSSQQHIQSAQIDSSKLKSDPSEQWHKMGAGKRPRPDRQKTLQYDVAVIGGGAAGICAALAAARIRGTWTPVSALSDIRTRLIKADIDTIETTALRIKLTETYGAEHIKLFEIRAYA